MKILNILAMALVIVGAINWGLVGLFKLDLVLLLLGGVPILMHLVYILIGIAGIYAIFLLKKCKCGDKDKC